MDNDITAGVAEGKASARNPSSERSPSVTHIHHYHGPVNSVGTAVNSNLGINYGSIEQTVRSGSTSSPCNIINHLSSSSTTMSTLPRIQASSFPSLLNPILDASHTRNRTLSPPNSKCFPGTREKVFKKVDSWIDSSLLFGNPHIMWIHGYAGCGKSAIAQVVAESMSSKGRLAASFFFFRGSRSRSTAGRLATTVASQLVASIPVTAPLIKAAIHANPGLLSTSSTSLSAQFQHLVYDPINEVKRDRFVASLRQGTFLIVLDGVDECDDRDEIASFIQHMIEFFEKKPRTPLRFLITSRVENHLYQRLHSSKQVKLLNLVEHTSDTDIAMALDVAISDEKRGLPFACEASWPSRKDRLQLVKHINGSYIFMTTITKLLFDRNNDDRLTPMQRLPLLLAMRPDFDALYHRTLATSQGLPHFRDIVSIVALAESPLSITRIAELLSIGTFYVSNVLVNLHSIMQVPGDDRSPVTLWHTSLRDFLTSEERAGPFFASPAYHLRIAFRCASLSNGGSSTSSSRTSWLEFSKNFAKEHLIKSAEGVEGTECTFNSGVLACITESLKKPWFGAWSCSSQALT
ncbi:hypothetical protein FA13DRAFT_201438 [Coprinellus micaceus]|uniref:NACHT domain-containing protein n=1 Tax=Coprinellus micaceus TaxID=71717 RepID=A0A4Y7SFZ8_COPMI|nr:hypothetical protein FA13DRAFT_201438 [Coprinellus micaceus]